MMFFACPFSIDNKGGYLKTRTYQGLDPRLGQTSVQAAVKGRFGVPIEYDKEPNSHGR